MFGMNSDDSSAKEKRNIEDDHVESKAFVLLNELSDLLMLPKDMLMEISIREEVCVEIHISVTLCLSVKSIVFTSFI